MIRRDFLKNSAVTGAGIVLFGLSRSTAQAAPDTTPLEFKATQASQWKPDATHVGFAQGLLAFPGEFPLLNRAVRDMRPALNTDVHWRNKAGVMKRNTTQITRTSFGWTNTFMASDMYYQGALSKEATLLKDRKTALHKHFTSIESCLEHGRRKKWIFRGWPEGGVMQIGQMGGWRELLGRSKRQRLRKGDVLRLRVLRDLTYCENRQSNDADCRTDEWISEVTLEAS